jgi:hypothetical protein
MSQTNITGEYFFRKTEMVARFNFTKAGTFQFLFSYGAVDRTASGTYTIEGNKIKLKSNKEPGRDFTVTAQNPGSRWIPGYIQSPQPIYTAIYPLCFCGKWKRRTGYDRQ